MLLTSGCSLGDDSQGARASPPDTIVVDGRTLEVSTLTEAVKGLCKARLEAATDARLAKSTYARRSEPGVNTVIQVLERSYVMLAGSMRRVVEGVEADGGTEPGRSSLAEDFGRLSEMLRDGLARIGVPTAPCHE